MSWLVPLGFIGLSGLAVLLLIYLIKPNYQNKIVSSTFVWKLSLQQKRRKNPISKINNLLLLIFQILIIVFCSLILAYPAIVNRPIVSDETVIIIDASASMLATGSDESTRFDRAVAEARTIAAETFDNNGSVSVVLAADVANIVVNRAGVADRTNVDESIAALSDGEGACTYGAADMDGAMGFANEIKMQNPATRTILLTGKQYAAHGDTEIRDMTLADKSEWNVAVLDCRADFNKNNAYVFYVDLACYGRDAEIALSLSVVGANGNNEYTYTFSADNQFNNGPIRLSGNRTTTVVIDTEIIPDDKCKIEQGVPQITPILTFKTAGVVAHVDDSILDDNQFWLYGNSLQTLNIQYASTKPNSFFSAAFSSITTALRRRWNINVREVRDETTVAATSGFDLYLFEEYPVSSMPTDGVVFLVNPSNLPSSLGMHLGSPVYNSMGKPLEKNTVNSVTDNISPENIIVTRFNPILINDETKCTPLLYCDGQPVLACINTASVKTVVMSFSVNYSTAPVNYDFPRLILNIVNYFIPTTFSGNVYNVNDVITFTPRGSTLTVTNPDGIRQEYTEFPATLELKRVGPYTTEQTTISNTKVPEQFFVRIPAAESNIAQTIDSLGNQLSVELPSGDIYDLCVYFAAVLLLLIVAERFLNARSAG